jgi:hypothetical protein
MRSADQLAGGDPARKLMIERIEAAIKALPAKPSANFRLVRLEILQAIDLLRGLDRPEFKPISQKLINRELDELARRATALSEYISSMHSGALAPVERQIPYINTTAFHGTLRSIADAVESVDRNPKPEQQLLLVEGKEYSLFGRMGGTKPGPKFKAAASHLAAAACAAYEAYTGKRATITTDTKSNERRGDFVRFVRNIFAAAGVKADAANYAKQAADIRRKVFGKTAVR